ncbi:unnamed protein product [Periconia digitata]|uniref:Short-chain dehydrogenase/reductase family protein n=1 Tax=Periconia digitata TaxID=1303443 RepID=A0A9W4XNY9_9PLEO|nr:unnamed protein product [Periconia digitata]
MSPDLQKRARSESTFLASVSRQLTKPKPLPDTIRLTAQVAIITGSNVGLGFEASRQLLQLGLAHLVMGVRSEAKGDAAAATLREEFPNATISVWVVDMASYASIRAFVERCASLPRIDITILNAGLTVQRFAAVAATGHETTVQVNYLSTALLSILLLPILKSKNKATTRPPVLTLVGSDSTYTAKVDVQSAAVLQQFDNPGAYEQFSWYAASKLLLAFFAIQLAEYVDPEEVLVNVVNPGLTKGTGFFGDMPLIIGFLMRLASFLLARSAEVGASNYVDAVVARGAESHGLFLSDWGVKPYPEMTYTAEGKAFSERLWDQTMEELRFVDASKIVDGLKNSR